jgi:type I restriction-modification system DNA methylase subunit
VRKAGGVYYTPQYIVEYIVENTIGKLIDGKTPEQVADIKIVDPACGSGSFLIGAYDYLQKWHLNYYRPEFTRLSEMATDTSGSTKARRRL